MEMDHISLQPNTFNICISQKGILQMLGFVAYWNRLLNQSLYYCTKNAEAVSVGITKLVCLEERADHGVKDAYKYFAYERTEGIAIRAIESFFEQSRANPFVPFKKLLTSIGMDKQMQV